MSSPAMMLATLAAYAGHRRLSGRLRTRADVEAHQARRLKVFLARDAARVRAFAGMAGRALADFPEMDKAALMADFAAYNRHGITADAVRAAIAAGGPVQGCWPGMSTGTSGNRGLYVVSDAERARWLGVMLSKALPGFWRRRERVAVMLPQASRLYDAANESGRLALKFFALSEGVERHLRALEAFAPSVVVAPPKVLRWLAESGARLGQVSAFSGGEVLDPHDRKVIEAKFRGSLREIYMATEGLLAVSCAHGRLHAAQDTMVIEWQAGPEGSGLHTPVITDVSRTTQIMVRYRMNDLVRLGEGACACGSPLQVIDEVVGRMDDVFVLGDGPHPVSVTPDVLRNAVLDADARIEDFRLRQTGAERVALTLPMGLQAALPGAVAAVQAALVRAGASAYVTGTTGPMPVEGGRKLRRVERCVPVHVLEGAA